MGFGFWSDILYDILDGILLFYWSCNGGTVYVDDNYTCELVSIRSVRITMFDRMISMINDVSYLQYDEEPLLAGMLMQRSLLVI